MGGGSRAQNYDAVNFTVVALAASLLILANLSFTLLRHSSGPPKERRIRKRRIERGYAVVLLIAFYSTGYVLGVRFAVTARQGALLGFLSHGHSSSVFALTGPTSRLLGSSLSRCGGTIWLTTLLAP